MVVAHLEPGAVAGRERPHGGLAERERRPARAHRIHSRQARAHRVAAHGPRRIPAEQAVVVVPEAAGDDRVAARRQEVRRERGLADGLLRRLLVVHQLPKLVVDVGGHRVVLVEMHVRAQVARRLLEDLDVTVLGEREAVDVAVGRALGAAPTEVQAQVRDGVVVARELAGEGPRLRTRDEGGLGLAVIRAGRCGRRQAPDQGEGDHTEHLHAHVIRHLDTEMQSTCRTSEAGTGPAVPLVSSVRQAHATAAGADRRSATTPVPPSARDHDATDHSIIRALRSRERPATRVDGGATAPGFV